MWLVRAPSSGGKEPEAEARSFIRCSSCSSLLRTKSNVKSFHVFPTPLRALLRASYRYGMPLRVAIPSSDSPTTTAMVGKVAPSMRTGSVNPRLVSFSDSIAG